LDQQQHLLRGGLHPVVARTILSASVMRVMQSYIHSKVNPRSPSTFTPYELGMFVRSIVADCAAWLKANTVSTTPLSCVSCWSPTMRS
jgi:hypothetical protein